MLKICDDLVSGKVSRDEILECNATEVDSTTDTESPVKRVKVDKKSVSKPKGKSNARTEAAKSRAKAIFASAFSNPGDGDNSSDSESDTYTTELKRQLDQQRQEIESLQRQLQKSCKNAKHI